MNNDDNLVVYILCWVMIIMGPLMTFYLGYLAIYEPPSEGNWWKLLLGLFLMTTGSYNSYRFIKAWKR